MSTDERVQVLTDEKGESEKDEKVEKQPGEEGNEDNVGVAQSSPQAEPSSTVLGAPGTLSTHDGPFYPPPSYQFPQHPEPPIAAIDATEGETKRTKQPIARNRGGVMEPFPEKLHKMLAQW